MVEYVKFNKTESLYGQKRFLHGELELINAVKRLRNYKDLRREELVLRLALKKRAGEALENLRLLDKLLPHARLPKVEKKPEKKPEEEKEENKVLTLDQELEIIRRKLETLERSRW